MNKQKVKDKAAVSMARKKWAKDRETLTPAQISARARAAMLKRKWRPAKGAE